MPSKNDNAGERGQLNETDMENRKAPAEAAVRRARGYAEGPGRQKKKHAGGSAQVLDKARFGQGNPRFSFDYLWPGFAGFGSVWLSLAQFGSIWLNLAQFGSIWLNFA
jgi:hypothetical protein